MSGFFANLLSRSRGTAAVVRPRLASLFEPGAPRASHGGGGPAAAAQPEATVTMATAGPAPIISSPAQGLALSRDAASSRSTAHARRGHDRPSHDGLQFADPDAGPGPGMHGRSGEGWETGDEAFELAGGTRPSARVDRGTAHGRRNRGDRAAAGASTTAGGSAFGDIAGSDATSTPGAGVMSASAMGATLARASGAPAGVSHRSNGSTGSHGTAAAGDASLAAHTTPAGALIAAARPPASLAPMPGSPPSRLHAGATASRSRPEADAAEPAIEISIGRIDVRAAVERGSDRTAPAAPSPVMGLEEYLQARVRARGGSR